MERRGLLRSALAITGLMAAPCVGWARDAKSAFEASLAAFAEDADAIEAANGYRERYQTYPGEPQGAQSASWTRASANGISADARDLIITCEVSSRATYDKRYRHPVWPGGSSGVTIGLGYDLGYATFDRLGSDWKGLLDDATLGGLASACGLKGEAAHLAVSKYAAVTLDWDVAKAQFDRFLPYAIGKTEDVFPNAAELSGDCRGALVSLVYNRGPSLAQTTRRREMRQIYTAMKNRDFATIPATIRAMKRLWEYDANARGLVRRREMEALLFEAGLV